MRKITGIMFAMMAVASVCTASQINIEPQNALDCVGGATNRFDYLYVNSVSATNDVSCGTLTVSSNANFTDTINISGDPNLTKREWYVGSGDIPEMVLGRRSDTVGPTFLIDGSRTKRLILADLSNTEAAGFQLREGSIGIFSLVMMRSVMGYTNIWDFSTRASGFAERVGDMDALKHSASNFAFVHSWTNRIGTGAGITNFSTSASSSNNEEVVTSKAMKDAIASSIGATHTATNDDATVVTPVCIGDELMIYDSTNVIYRAFGLTTNDWVQVFP